MKNRRETITICGSKVNCVIKGEGIIPCIVVGAAGLFAKESMLPEKLGRLFTFFCADTWDMSSRLIRKDQDVLSWDSLLAEIEDTRKQFKLEKVAVFGHSAAGGLALEYARKFPENCLFVVVIAFPPNWTPKHQEEIEQFILLNADDKRKSALQEDKRDFLEKKASMTPEQEFIESFIANKAIFWKDYQSPKTKESIQEMWRDYRPDVKKVIGYAQGVLSNYNFFERQRNVSKIKVPVFWGMGIYDFFAPCVELTDELLKGQSGHGNIEYHVFENSGHYPMNEDPQEFADMLIKHVKENIPRPKL